MGESERRATDNREGGGGGGGAATDHIVMGAATDHKVTGASERESDGWPDLLLTTPPRVQMERRLTDNTTPARHHLPPSQAGTPGGPGHGQQFKVLTSIDENIKIIKSYITGIQS